MLLHFNFERKPELFSMYDLKQFTKEIDEHFKANAYHLLDHTTYLNHEEYKGIIEYCAYTPIHESEIPPFKYYIGEEYILIEFRYI